MSTHLNSLAATHDNCQKRDTTPDMVNVLYHKFGRLRQSGTDSQPNFFIGKIG